MKLGGARIPIEARSAGEVLDLAVRLHQAHLAPVFRLTAAFAVPASGLAWALAAWTEDGAFLSLALFAVLAPFLGGVLVSGVGPWVFGEPLRFRRALGAVLSRAGPLLGALLPTRLASVFLAWVLYREGSPYLHAWLLLAGLLLARSYAAVEVICLERLEGARLRRRLRGLRTGARDLGTRWFTTFFFLATVVAVLFTLVDLSVDALLGIQLFWGRVWPALDWGYAPRIVDPGPIVLLQVLLWLVYPLGRLALFLHYLDARIRMECWDVELDFRIEAARLEGRAPPAAGVPEPSSIAGTGAA